MISSQQGVRRVIETTMPAVSAACLALKFQQPAESFSSFGGCGKFLQKKEGAGKWQDAASQQFESSDSMSATKPLSRSFEKNF